MWGWYSMHAFTMKLQWEVKINGTGPLEFQYHISPTLPLTGGVCEDDFAVNTPRVGEVPHSRLQILPIVEGAQGQSGSLYLA